MKKKTIASEGSDGGRWGARGNEGERGWEGRRWGARGGDWERGDGERWEAMGKGRGNALSRLPALPKCDLGATVEVAIALSRLPVLPNQCV